MSFHNNKQDRATTLYRKYLKAESLYSTLKLLKTVWKVFLAVVLPLGNPCKRWFCRQTNLYCIWRNQLRCVIFPPLPRLISASSWTFWNCYFPNLKPSRWPSVTISSGRYCFLIIFCTIVFKIHTGFNSQQSIYLSDIVIHICLTFHSPDNVNENLQRFISMFLNLSNF